MTTLPPAERAQPGSDAAARRGGRTAWLALAVAVVLVAGAALVIISRHHDGSSTAGVTPSHLVGHPLPDATYQDFSGASATLASFQGRPVVLNFWSATCAACRTEMPSLQRIHRQDGDQVTFLGVDSGDGRTTGRDAARQSGVSYALAFDPESRLATQLGAVALPTTVVVGADGVVTHVHVGAVDPRQLERWIAQAG